MPAEKANRRQVRQAEYNKPIRTRTRSRVVAARDAIKKGPASPETGQALKQAIRDLDKAASKGVIHRNNAARRKSRLMQAFNKAVAK